MDIRAAQQMLRPISAAAAVLLGLALTVASWPAAAQQWTPEQRAACEPDAMRLCQQYHLGHWPCQGVHAALGLPLLPQLDPFCEDPREDRACLAQGATGRDMGAPASSAAMRASAVQSSSA
jgi:hypothetical protein